MPVTRTFLLFTAAALLWPSAGRAQSLERSIERWAQSIAANAERLAAKLERKANLIARDIERPFSAMRPASKWARASAIACLAPS